MDGTRYRFSLILIALLVVSQTANAFDAPQRRRDQYGHEFGYYLYPIAGDIPGLGTASGLGATVLNMFDSDTDFTAFNIKGDFSASGYALLNMPLKKQRVIADAGYYDFNVAPVQYFRGINSSPDNYILPRAAGKYLVAQLTLTYDERRYEPYYRVLSGKSHLIEVRDKNGTPFAAIDSKDYDYLSQSIGFSADLTDDRTDPRRGVRVEFSANLPNNDNPQQSDYYVTDLNVTGYLPMRQHDTLAANFFLSNAHVTRTGVTDYATLQAQDGLNCSALTGAAQTQCLATENVFINERIAANKYGIATPLGGTQRLRSYDNGRFYAGNTLFWGLEYRWNLTDEYTPFDIKIARGIRTGIQLAAFYEAGTVADDWRYLYSNMRHSYGLGFRLVLSGLIVRADYAQGDEESRFQLFINYPWSMFSVDSPG